MTLAAECSDLIQSSGLTSLANVFGIGGVFMLITLVGVFWTLHKHGGSLNVYLQARGSAFEDRMKLLEAEAVRERTRGQDCEARREKDLERWNAERREMLEKIEALDAGINSLRAKGQT